MLGAHELVKISSKSISSNIKYSIGLWDSLTDKLTRNIIE